MEQKKSPKVRFYLPTTLILIVLGWGGLYILFTHTIPSGGTRWAFFFFTVIALTAIALPSIAFLNIRFPTKPPASVPVIIRQALWVGIYIPTLAWLRIGRILTLAVALLLAAGLFIVEWLIRLRERSLWKPDD